MGCLDTLALFELGKQKIGGGVNGGGRVAQQRRRRRLGDGNEDGHGQEPQGERERTSPRAALSQPHGSHPVLAVLFLSSVDTKKAPGRLGGALVKVSRTADLRP